MNWYCNGRVTPTTITHIKLHTNRASYDEFQLSAIFTNIADDVHVKSGRFSGYSEIAYDKNFLYILRHCYGTAF